MMISAVLLTMIDMVVISGKKLVLIIYIMKITGS